MAATLKPFHKIYKIAEWVVPAESWRAVTTVLAESIAYTDDLFAVSQPAEATRVMSVLDQINERWGRGTLRAASVPTTPDWGMRRDMMSQSYTTKLDQLWSVACK